MMRLTVGLGESKANEPPFEETALKARSTTRTPLLSMKSRSDRSRESSGRSHFARMTSVAASAVCRSRSPTSRNLPGSSSESRIWSGIVFSREVGRLLGDRLHSQHQDRHVVLQPFLFRPHNRLVQPLYDRLGLESGIGDK